MPSIGSHGLPPLTPSVRGCLIVLFCLRAGRYRAQFGGGGVRRAFYHTLSGVVARALRTRRLLFALFVCGTAAQHPPRRKNPGLHGVSVGVCIVCSSPRTTPRRTHGSRRQTVCGSRFTDCPGSRLAPRLPPPAFRTRHTGSARLAGATGTAGGWGGTCRPTHHTHSQQLRRLSLVASPALRSGLYHTLRVCCLW